MSCAELPRPSKVGCEALRSAGYAFAALGFFLASWPQQFAGFGLMIGLACLCGVMWVLRSLGPTSEDAPSVVELR